MSICKKCKRDLPRTELYFPKDKSCKDGLRSVCRECNPKYGKFLEENHRTNKKWSEEDLELLKSIYKDYTNQELIDNFFQDRTLRSLETIANKYGVSYKTEETKQRANESRKILCKEANIGRIISDETRKKMSDIKKKFFETHSQPWEDKTRSEEFREEVSKRMKGKWSGDKNPRHINPLTGENNGRWNGGNKPLIDKFRNDIKEWKLNTAEFCNYKCVLTGERFNDIHHIEPFINIVNKVFDNNNLERVELAKVSDYDGELVNKLSNDIIKEHSNTYYGICLKKELHELFHKEYGYINNNKEQIIEYINKLKYGKYDYFLKENNIVLNINNDYVEYLTNSK